MLLFVENFSAFDDTLRCWRELGLRLRDCQVDLKETLRRKAEANAYLNNVMTSVTGVRFDKSKITAKYNSMLNEGDMKRFKERFMEMDKLSLLA